MPSKSVELVLGLGGGLFIFRGVIRMSEGHRSLQRKIFPIQCDSCKEGNTAGKPADKSKYTYVQIATDFSRLKSFKCTLLLKLRTDFKGLPQSRHQVISQPSLPTLKPQSF